MQTFPKRLFYILRTIQILRGLSLGMDSPFSSSEMWKPLALQVLASHGKSSNQSDPGERHNQLCYPNLFRYTLAGYMGVFSYVQFNLLLDQHAVALSHSDD